MSDNKTPQEQPQAVKPVKTPLWQRLRKNRISAEDYAQLQDETTPPPSLPIQFSDSRRIILWGLLIIG
ncbi:MAG: hypothetical protein M0O99_07565, partial [Desulfuromonas thiophila]|nr:hypothetical protein [Desulfuromonas thiophila]